MNETNKAVKKATKAILRGEWQFLNCTIIDNAHNGTYAVQQYRNGSRIETLRMNREGQILSVAI